jgi:hypothetical protein
MVSDYLALMEIFLPPKEALIRALVTVARPEMDRVHILDIPMQ